jgi:carbamoyltransferase
MGTDLDKLVIGGCFLEKNKQNVLLKKDYTKEFELD